MREYLRRYFAGFLRRPSSSGPAPIVAPTPTFQAAGTKAEGTGDVSVAWPTHAVDDVALLFVESNGSEPAVLGTPSGFVEVDGSPQFDDGGGNTTRLTVFWCRASSTSMPNAVITDPGNHCEAVIVTYRGCRTFDVPYSAAAGGATSGTSTTSITIPSAVTEAPNCRVVIAISNGGGWDASGYANGNLSGITERFDDYTGLGGAGGLSIADGEYPGPGDWGDTSATLGAVQLCGFMTIALTGSSGSGSTVTDDALSSLGSPIVASRIWTTGLSDDGYFIAQSYPYGSEIEPEWQVFNLNTGTYQTYLGPAGIAGNSNYVVSDDVTSVSGPTGGNQVRAPSGRIFFPCFGLHVAYYEPTTKAVEFLSVTDTDSHAVLFRMEFGNNGKIYGSTQTNSGTGSLPAVVELDPVTLDYRVVGHVGTPGTLLYGYFVAVEDGGERVYVAVGQDPWELWSIEVATGIATKLDPGTGPYTHIEFNKRTEGWTARFSVGLVSVDYWVIDGVLYPGAPTYSGGFTPRDVTAGPVLLTDAMDVDWTDGNVGLLRYRERGAGSYTELEFESTKVPASLDAVVILPDGTPFVTGTQYTGVARLDGDWVDYRSNIVSQPVFTASGLYFSGYPNGVLHEYDPESPWNPGVNPVELGTFAGPAGSLSDMKYTYFLSKSGNRIYCTGRRERSGTGSGIAVYDTVAETFDGHHLDPLEEYTPRGLLVLSDRVLFSGERSSGDAKLLVFDLDLVLTDELDVGMGTNTGLLFATDDEDVVLGINDDTVYRYELSTETVLAQETLGTVKAVTQHSDGRLLAVVNNELVEINPTTLAVTPRLVVVLDYAVRQLVWTDDDEIYVLAGPELYQVT